MTTFDHYHGCMYKTAVVPHLRLFQFAYILVSYELQLLNLEMSRFDLTYNLQGFSARALVQVMLI